MAMMARYVIYNPSCLGRGGVMRFVRCSTLWACSCCTNLPRASSEVEGLSWMNHPLAHCELGCLRSEVPSHALNKYGLSGAHDQDLASYFDVRDEYGQS